MSPRVFVYKWPEIEWLNEYSVTMRWSLVDTAVTVTVVASAGHAVAEWIFN